MPHLCQQLALVNAFGVEGFRTSSPASITSFYTSRYNSQIQALAPIYWKCLHLRALKCFVSCSKVMTLITGTTWARSRDPHYCSPHRCAFPFRVCLRMFPGAQGEKKPAAVICISNKGSGCTYVYANTALLLRRLKKAND